MSTMMNLSIADLKKMADLAYLSGQGKLLSEFNGEIRQWQKKNIQSQPLTQCYFLCTREMFSSLAHQDFLYDYFQSYHQFNINQYYEHAIINRFMHEEDNIATYVRNISKGRYLLEDASVFTSIMKKSHMVNKAGWWHFLALTQLFPDKTIAGDAFIELVQKNSRLNLADLKKVKKAWDKHFSGHQQGAVMAQILAPLQNIAFDQVCSEQHGHYLQLNIDVDMLRILKAETIQNTQRQLSSVLNALRQFIARHPFAEQPLSIIELSYEQKSEKLTTLNAKYKNPERKQEISHFLLKVIEEALCANAFNEQSLKDSAVETLTFYWQKSQLEHKLPARQATRPKQKL